MIRICGYSIAFAMLNFSIASLGNAYEIGRANLTIKNQSFEVIYSLKQEEKSKSGTTRLINKSGSTFVLRNPKCGKKHAPDEKRDSRSYYECACFALQPDEFIDANVLNQAFHKTDFIQLEYLGRKNEQGFVAKNISTMRLNLFSATPCRLAITNYVPHIKTKTELK